MGKRRAAKPKATGRPAAVTHISHLQDECLQLIAAKLGFLDRMRLSRACKMWHGALSGPSEAWRVVVLDHATVNRQGISKEDVLRWFASRARGIEELVLASIKQPADQVFWQLCVLAQLTPSLLNLEVRGEL